MNVMSINIFRKEFNLHQNIHFGAKTRKTSFYVLSFSSFLQSKEMKKKVPKKTQEKHAVV